MLDHVPSPGDPPQAAAWLGQCGIYLLIMVLEKGVISLVLLVPGWSKVRCCLCWEETRRDKNDFDSNENMNDI